MTQANFSAIAMWLNFGADSFRSAYSTGYMITHTLDMLSQRTELDALERLNSKAIRKREFIQFGGDGFGANGIHVAPDSQIHVRARRVRSFGTRAEEPDQPNLGMSPEDTRGQAQFMRGQPGCLHGAFLLTKNSCKDAIAGR